MHSGNPEEHFVTLFDSNFLPMGLCLHNSMMEQAQPFHLWILCMDELVEKQLRQLDLPHVSLIPLREVETKALLDVKGGRTQGEYCWTLTPFTPQFVFDRDEKILRVTYLDADLFFFAPPRILIDEFETSGKHVLITEHAYAPEYDKTEKSGKFCVQFMTFRRTEAGIKVMRWWQDRCLEWCFFRDEDGKLGDQKYLNDWPERFPAEVHVLRQTERTLAPWNAAYFLDREHACVPVFFHFQNFRVLSERKMRWCRGFKIGVGAVQYYQRYSSEIINSLVLIRDRWGIVPAINDEKAIKRRIAKYYYILAGTARYFKYSLDRRA